MKRGRHSAGNGNAGFPCETDHQIGDARLVFQGHQRDDVAGGFEVRGGLELPLEAGQVLAAGGVQHFGAVGIRRYSVSPMQQVTGGAADVPAAPAICERRAVIGKVLSAAKRGCAVRARVRRSDEEARHVECGRAHVALQADHVPAEEGRFRGLVHGKGIELYALPGVKRHDFEHFAVLHGADEHVVSEVERAGRFGRDARCLKTGFREDQNLRIAIDVEAPEHVWQVAATGVVLELDLAGFQLFLELSDAVGGRIHVLNGGMVVGDPGVVGERIGGGGGSHCEEERGSEADVKARRHGLNYAFIMHNLVYGSQGGRLGGFGALVSRRIHSGAGRVLELNSARIIGRVAQLVRAPASHAGGPGFESLRAHHFRISWQE